MEYVIREELPRATPEINKAVEELIKNPKIIITNICEQYGQIKDKDHEICGAIDIAKRNLQDLPGALAWIESQGLACVSHYNNSGAEAPLEEKDSHFHCTVRLKLPESYEEWKYEIASEIYYRATKAGLDGKLAVAVAIAESGLNPNALGDSRCSKGLFQWNECARGKMPDDLIGAYITEIKSNMEKYNWSQWQSLVSWNCPQCAKSGSYKTKYYYKVLKIYNSL